MGLNQSAENQIYDRIKNAITKRYIRQGNQLVETTIANQLGVSRTPVRAAIKRLVYDGYAEFVPNKGAFIITPSDEEILEAFAVRLTLETMAVELAAKNMTVSEIKTLYKYVEDETKIFNENRYDEYYKVNNDIHFSIARASGNKILYQYIQDIINKSKIFQILADPIESYSIGHPTIEEHIHIIKAVEKRDVKAAKKEMKIHLKNTLNELRGNRTLPEDYLSL